MSDKTQTILLCSALLAATPAAVRAAPAEAHWGLDIGYRQDELDWSIAGWAPTATDRYIDVLSELSWTELETLQVRGHLALHFSRAWLLSGYAGFGSTRVGEVRDSDYLSSGRQQEWSRSQSDAADSLMVDVEAGIGYVFGANGYFGQGWRVVPSAGLALHVQDLKVIDGNQTVSQTFPDQHPDVGAPPVGPFAGLDSSYRAEWFGPWAGLEVGFAGANGLSAGLRAQYHFLTSFYAAADWNLRSDFEHPISFEHEADGQGIALSGSLDYSPARRLWSLGVGFGWRKHWTEAGNDTVYFSDGTVARTRLNEVNWTSSEIDLRWRYRF
jgi:hypothetical protein